MVYIVLRKSFLHPYGDNKDFVRMVGNIADEIADSLDSPEGTWLNKGDEIYEAKLVFKIVSKPKVIETSELVLEDVK